MSGLYSFVWPLLRCLDPEAAHGLAIFALKRGLVPSAKPIADPRLSQTLWGLEFANPVGLAAGFDKNAEVVQAMLSQGFGFVEAGTVTPKPQTGNPKPRLFRLTGDGAGVPGGHSCSSTGPFAAKPIRTSAPGASGASTSSCTANTCPKAPVSVYSMRTPT